jgi:hypothetical protein
MGQQVMVLSSVGLRLLQHQVSDFYQEESSTNSEKVLQLTDHSL